jgi:hypothetical protein
VFPQELCGGGLSTKALVRRTLGALLAVALVAATSGCSRESRHDVRSSVEQLASIAAEGALMGDDLARGRTKTTFVRVHGEELSAQAEHEAEKLNDAPVSPDLRAPIQKAIKLSSDIGSAIDDMRVSPQDRAQARSATGKLRRLSMQARKLSESM